jgi:predicted nucleotidyltransferase
LIDQSQVKLPVLPPHYEAALRSAIEFILTTFDPFAVIVTGSIIRGNPDPSSDFDILVLHRHPWRRRIQKWFQGVPAEIFINSPEWMESYFSRESSEGRPVMAHMITTGVIAFSSSTRTAEIIELGRASIQNGAFFSEVALEQQRYAAACLFEDAFEVYARDATAAALILSRAVETTVRYWFASKQRFIVRSKEQLQVIRNEDRQTAELIDRTLLATEMEHRIAAGHALAKSIIGHTGFFEWDSGPSEFSSSS